jgi:hypothetical protein
MKKVILIIGSLSSDEEVFKWKEEVKRIVSANVGNVIMSTNGRNLGQLVATFVEEMRQEGEEVSLISVTPPRKAFFSGNGKEKLTQWREYFFSEHGDMFSEVIAISGGGGTKEEIEIIKKNFPEMPIKYFQSPVEYIGEEQ